MVWFCLRNSPVDSRVKLRVPHTLNHALTKLLLKIIRDLTLAMTTKKQQRRFPIFFDSIHRRIRIANTSIHIISYEQLPFFHPFLEYDGTGLYWISKTFCLLPCFSLLETQYCLAYQIPGFPSSVNQKKKSKILNIGKTKDAYKPIIVMVLKSGEDTELKMQRQRVKKAGSYLTLNF